MNRRTEKNNTRKKLYLFCPRLGGGGAEKQALRLLNSFDRSRYDLNLIVLNKKGEYMVELSSDVTVTELHVGGGRSSTVSLLLVILPLAQFLRRKRPDIVISVLGNAGLAAALAIIFAGLKGKLKFIYRVQTTPLESLNNNRTISNRIFYALYPVAYNMADTIVAVSEGVKQELIARNSKWSSKVRTIYNIVDAIPTEPRALVEADQKMLRLAVCGRLVKLKSFELAIAVLAELRQRGIETTLDILGTGPEEANLKCVADKLGVRSVVRFHGFHANPRVVYSEVDVFLLTSRYEGFPNVLIEAMATGVPVVATNCKYGPAEIVQHGVNGYLVPVGDVRQMTTAIEKMWSDRELYCQMRYNALESCIRFVSEGIVPLYEKEFDK